MLRPVHASPSARVGVSLFALAIGLSAGSATAQQAGTIVLDEITVTGERQTRSLQDTSSSVTVIPAEEVRNRADGARQLYDALGGIPNVTAQGASEVPAIRGLQSSGAGGLAGSVLQGTLPRAPLIVDEIARPTGMPAFSFLSLYDVEQVEVLRGPQSTLRGRNAIGGAFVVSTRDPVFKNEFGFRTGLSFDRFGGPDHAVAGMANLVLIPDRVAGRFVLEHQGANDPRKVYRLPSFVDRDSELTDSTLTRLRGKLLITPQGENGDLRIKLSADVQDGRVPQTRDAVAGPGASGIPFRYRAIPLSGLGYQRIFDTQAQTLGADVEYRLPDGSKLRSITSFARDAFKSAQKQTDTQRFNVADSIFNQDFLYNFGSETGPYGGVVGVNINERWQDALAVGITRLKGRISSQALFADLRFGLTEKLDLIAGGRVNRNQDERVQFGFLVPGRTNYEKTETVFLPKLGLAYRIDDNQRISVTARQGYNPGGASLNFFTGTPYTYKSEKVWTLETTYRAKLLDDRVTFGATVFYNWHEDPQLYLQRDPTNRFSLEIVNLPKGRSYGAEFELRGKVNDQVEAKLGLGLLRTEITEGLPTNPQLKGNRFGRDPGVTPSFGVSWKPLPQLTLDAQVAYVSRYFSDLNNLQIEKVGGYATLDFGATYEIRSGMSARAFVRNATDADAYTRKIGTTTADLTPPRTIGISLDAKF